MRLAYEAHESTRENLSKLVSQHQKKEEIFHDKVKDIMNDHEERLKERIHRRKLKTATYRSRPEDTNDTSTKQMDIEIIQ
jgi:argininosuccinate lyase